MDIFRKILLLLWKNLLLRRRHYIVSICEVILPTFFLCILAIKVASTTSEERAVRRDGTARVPLTRGDEVNVVFGNDTIPAIQFEEDLMQDAITQLLTPYSLILFSPNTTLAREVMNRVMTNLGSNQSRMFGLNSETEILQALNDYNKKAEEMDLDWKAIPHPFKGIVFEGPFNWNTSRPPPGTIVSYKIRLVEVAYSRYSPDDSSTKTKILKYPLHPGSGTGYKESGFSGLQVALDKAIIWMLANKREPTQKIQTQPMPYPSHNYTEGDEREIDDSSPTHYEALLLSMLTVLGFVIVVPSVIRNVVSERETGIKELMKMMGLPNWMHWLGWMMSSLILLLVTITIATILVFAPFTENGGVLINADFTLWFFVLLLFATATVSFCFLISSFFQRPVLALTAGIVLYLTTFGVIMPIYVKHKAFNLHHKLALSLMPNVAFFIANSNIFFQELTGGARWTTLFKPTSRKDDLALGYTCLMLIVDTIVFTALAIYIENIIPSEFGLTKPWYYPVKMIQCRRKPQTGRITPEIVGEEQESEDRPGFEPELTDLHAGVVIHNLRKEFGQQKVAVNMVGTLKMYDGQITALLGHNGAGKTTTLSILTGLFAPTSGTATVNGYDIRRNMDKVRQNLGLCPQHNMLFEKLTVQEHLIFFGTLKGLTKRQALEASRNLLLRMNFVEKTHVRAGALSGGQKRKLSLAIAIIGGTKVVILDEPTSGMDPEARRAIWDLLLGMRGERTIILTTHFMEEADVLGDRIAIMADGQVKCCGTPAFLRKYYGVGYTLKLTVTDPSVRPNILVLVQKHFLLASFKTSQSGNTAQVDITIPTEQNTNSAFPGFFSDLASEQQQLGLQTFGLSLSTMDDIFVKVGTDAGLAEDEFKNDDVVISESGIDVSNTARLKGFGLVFQQFYAIFIKRMLTTWRNRKLFVTQLFLPVGLLILCILLGNVVMRSSINGLENVQPPPMKMELSGFQNPVTMFQASTSSLETTYAGVVGNSSLPVTGNLSLALLNEGKRDLEAYRSRYVVAGDLSDRNATAIFSALPDHASPLSVNLISNAILKSMTSPNNYKIEVSIHPIYFEPRGPKDDSGGSTLHSAVSTSYLYGVLITIGFAVLLASYVVSPMEERLCNAKQLQLMTGVKPVVYWAASFLWDYCSIFLLICIMLVCYAIFQIDGIFTANNGTGVLFLILMAFGFVGISSSYFCSNTCLKTIPGAFSFVTIANAIFGILVSIYSFNLELEGNSMMTYLYHLFRICPTFGGTLNLMRFTYIAVKNSHCGTVGQAMLRIACNTSSLDDMSRSFHNIKPCCRDCEPFFPKKGGVEVLCSPEPFLRWSTRVQFEINGTLIQYSIPGISQEILYMVIYGLLYQAIILLIEHGLFKRLASIRIRRNIAVFARSDSSTDEDVKIEKERVAQLVRAESTAEDALVVDNLWKRFGTFAAVSGLTFGVHHGECFGLLGVNGAGKTTAFRMLTGDEKRSFGNAYNMGLSMDKNRVKFLSRIGYCPQFDGIIGVLTGKEMIDLFARLRGIRWENVDDESNEWLFKVGLLESANVQCRKYSGGMKRRLCAAVALVGDPPVVLLDEPTTGVDPVARRQFWKVIDSVRKSGKAVVLTSHSMEECEALCSRLGIMVNGQFQCLGGVQHLKAKFAQGFKLVVTLNKTFPQQAVQTQPPPPPLVQNAKEQAREDEWQELEPSTEPQAIEPDVWKAAPYPKLTQPARQITDEEHVNLLCDEILNTYNSSFLRERHQRMLEFQVVGIAFRWGQVFEMMEGIRAKFEDLIEDYSITETTLEEVFLSLARMQYPEREVAASCLKKCCKC